MAEMIRKLFHNNEKCFIDDIPRVTELEPLDAIVKVDAALLTNVELKKHLSDSTPRGLGSSACGTVVEIGEEVHSFKVGDKVVFNANMPCYVCNDCQRGNSSRCQHVSPHHQAGGSIAEYMFIYNAEANLANQPETVSDELACYAPSLMAKAMYAIDQAKLPVGSIVGVTGLGPYGLMSIACANLSCAGFIYAMVNNNKHEMRYAKEFGADSSVTSVSDSRESIMELSNGVGLDAFIDCSGDAQVLKECIDLTRIGGSVIRTESPKNPDNALLESMLEAQSKGITVENVSCPTGGEFYERMLRLIEKNRIDPSMLTTHRCDFDDIEDYIKDLDNDPEQLIETILIEF